MGFLWIKEVRPPADKDRRVGGEHEEGLGAEIVPLVTRPGGQMGAGG